jgi:ribonuclease T2
MFRHRVHQAAQTAAVTLSFLFIFAIVVLAQERQTQGSFAQDRRQNTPGQFDFYVLALSWSPSYCEAALDRAIVGSALELMPSPRLIFHEWDRHGTCSGLSQHAYFEAVRKARAVVKIPADFIELDKPITVKPDDVAEAFVKANPGLARADLAVACDSKRLSEVRVCLNKDFSFRGCPEVARRACKSDSVALPAMRGG